jgi:hypothetical protein
MTDTAQEHADAWLELITALFESRAAHISYLVTVERRLVELGAIRPDERAVLSRRERKAVGHIAEPVAPML